MVAREGGTRGVSECPDLEVRAIGEEEVRIWTMVSVWKHGKGKWWCAAHVCGGEEGPWRRARAEPSE